MPEYRTGTVARPSIPPVPLTLEGASALHQVFRFRWPEWKALAPDERAGIAAEAAALLEEMERNTAGQSALYSVLGHKGDLLLVHFRPCIDELKRAELALRQFRLGDFLDPAYSFLSVVELGLYESSVKIFTQLAERGIEPHSPEWQREVDSLLDVQRNAMRPRLYPEMPPHRFVCFYPMDRRRGEQNNFYTVPIGERGRMMREHGETGRRYAGEVKQIITGSMGLDDWEWGVTLWSDDPLAFKKLVYEMRFDEASALYASFGPFYVGIRCAAGEIGEMLEGRI